MTIGAATSDSAYILHNLIPDISIVVCLVSDYFVGEVIENRTKFVNLVSQ